MKKKVISIALVLALALSLAALSGCGSSKVTLNVYNWGMNIADGEDGYIDVIELFEKKYPTSRSTTPPTRPTRRSTPA